MSVTTVSRWQLFLRHASQALAVLRLLSPTVIQLLAALMPLPAYILSDQGADVLSMLGDGLFGGDPVAFRRAGWFVVVNTFAGVAIWWTARMTLEFRLVPLSLPWGRWKDVRDCARTWWPRLLGAGAVLNVGVAFLVHVRDYGTKQLPIPPGIQRYRVGLVTLGWMHFAAAALLTAFFFTRRAWLRKGNAPDPGGRYRNVWELRTQSPGDFYFSGILVIVSMAILASLWISPIGWGQHLGTGAILSLSAITGVTFGTIVLFVQARTGLPVVVVLVGWVAWCSDVMNNHDIRESREPGPVPAKADSTVAQAVGEWFPERSVAQSSAESVPGIDPIFVVATEGGGIRAAFWTALILGRLQDETAPVQTAAGEAPSTAPDFASRLFAVSGVSGGSVGATVFAALLADGEPDLEGKSTAILGEDHLSPLIGTLLFPEVVQRFWPRVLPHTDRAAAIEQSWERSYRRWEVGSGRLAAPFRNLWRDKGKHLPHLLLNSTLVDTGQRLIFSDLIISAGPPGGEFLDARDVRELLYSLEGGRHMPIDVPLSTAAHASARFTYTNPAGRLTTKDQFVDGGYFEDSGATTALEVIQAIERVQEARDSAWEAKAAQAKRDNVLPPPKSRRLVPVVINISNDPTVVADGARSETASDATAGSPPPEQKALEPFHFASELLSPPLALMDTRGARGTFARRAICEHQRRQWDKLSTAEGEAWTNQFAGFFHLEDPNPSQHGIPTYIEFGLVKQGIPLPLGWALSQGAKDEMESQLDTSRQSGMQSNPVSVEAVKLWLKLAH